ncbi:hypothetical protein [Corynebacterium mucifaciens]|uniref:Membrane protein YdbT with pleckstrin-like domain n=1 Tax=Corynebacterium mucifaciens TaxID=57171 RepID=A0A7X6LQI2_9CORY|nr:hypothetical protein [Corynebacterium mucifaciens]NKY68002.1 hypothetical protein [Corynebacterium mucifaciens]
MTEPVVRDDFTRREAIAGLAWLSIGALVSLLLEAVYLNWLWVVAALLFNAVVTKTARLWSSKWALLPLAVWVAGFLVSLALLPPTSWSLALLLAGVAGGVWPMIHRK